MRFILQLVNRDHSIDQTDLTRAFRFDQKRKIEPQIDIFNLTNSNVSDLISSAVGGTYLVPQTIVAPRIIRVGFSVNF